MTNLSEKSLMENPTDVQKEMAKNYEEKREQRFQMLDTEGEKLWKKLMSGKLEIKELDKDQGDALTYIIAHKINWLKEVSNVVNRTFDKRSNNFYRREYLRHHEELKEASEE